MKSTNGSISFHPPRNVTDTLLKFQGLVPERQNDMWKQKGGRFNSDKGLWLGQKGKSILPIGAQYPILQYIYELTRWNSNKKVLWDKHYFGSLPVVQRFTQGAPIAQNITQGNNYTVLKDIFPLLSCPFKVWLIVFNQMLPSQSYQNMLLMICMFSHWIEAFPCRSATLQSVGTLIFKEGDPYLMRFLRNTQ